jgi:hypothetical protein
MKSALLFIAFAIGIFTQATAQCDIVVTLTQTNTNVCANDPLDFLGYASGACPGAASIAYNWQASVIDSEGNVVMPAEYMVTGNTFTFTTIPVFTYAGSEELSLVCLTLVAYDNLGNPIGTGQYCSSSFYYPQPIIPTAVVTNNQCGDQACVYVTTTGGSGPYSYQVSDGSLLSGNAYGCFNAPGVYTVEVVDQNGCSGFESFIVLINETPNNTCDNAAVLDNGITLQDTLCNLEFATPSCSGLTYYQTGWYQINSGLSTHLQVGVSSGYTPGAVTQNVAIEILASSTDCSAATQVFCETNINCFDLADYINIEPNTNYYIHVMTQWTSTVPISIVAVLGDTPQEGICGCTNSASCNYDPEALVDNGSCGYNGCTDPGACNYLAYATCDDGSCIFGNDLTGHVFHDVNGDMIYSTWPISEPSIGVLGYVYVEELDIMIYPNSEGEFVIPELPSAVYQVSYIDPSNTWQMASGTSLAVTLPTCTGLNIALVPVSGATAQISGNYSNWPSVIQCNNGVNIGVWIQNTGTTNFSGNFTINFDPLLTVANLSYAIPFTSVTGTSATWEIVDQAPGTSAQYMLHINGPGASYVGQYFNFSYSLQLIDNTDVLFYSNDWTTSNVVSCAYDPNDKQAIPVGYAEPHFILADTEIEYKIRFQNTGNAPAFNVDIQDQLDISKLDLSTFQPITASHSYSTLVQPDGHVTFTFANIMLPDSTTDEPGSQGYVIYRIKPLPTVEFGDVIENTASIYFDENPPIVTNTTFHTIYDCSQMPQVVTSYENCEETEQILGWDYEYIESSEWLVNGELQSEEIEFLFPNTVGSYFIQNTISNPLCSSTSDYYVNVNPNPEVTIMQEGDELIASEGTYYQWYIFDQPITDGNNQNQLIYASGPYTVTVINEFGCMATSPVFTAVGVDDVNENSFVIYPNPAGSMMTIEVQNNAIGSFYNITDATGKIVLSGKVNSITNQISLDNLSAGAYQISIHNTNDISTATFVKFE